MTVIEAMDVISDIKGKRVLVAGLARSGVSAANLLAGLGADVTVTDSKPVDQLTPYAGSLLPGIRVMAGGNPPDAFRNAELIVLSPGVPLDAEPVRTALNEGRPVIGELEAAYQALSLLKARLKGRALNDTHLMGPHFIGITGTNGKSTVTTLVDMMLREFGYASIAAGNIGRAVSGIVKGLMESGEPSSDIPDYLVTEISSFQLETIQEFRPSISVILNISPDHLDRYDSLDDYIGAKAKIYMNQQPDDYLVLNADDPALMRLRRRGTSGGRAHPSVLYFSRREKIRGIYLRDGMLWCNLPDIHVECKDTPIIPEQMIRIRGSHNVENAMAAVLVAVLAGVSAVSTASVLTGFQGLEHRLEFVRELNGVTFINDSKATNVGAVLKSLDGLSNVILIMGGLDKAGDFSVLKDAVSGTVKRLILMGAAAGKIRDSLGSNVDTAMAGSMDDAVAAANASASSGDTVLLAPGCASFDMFENFEERGRHFREAVMRL